MQETKVAKLDPRASSDVKLDVEMSLSECDNNKIP